MPFARYTGAGSTRPGEQWQDHGTNGIYIDVDTSDARFTTTPVYVTSIGSTGGGNWMLTGTAAIYSPTSTGFRMYLRWIDSQTLRVTDAQRFGWYVNWIGVETVSCPEPPAPAA
jgi:hypothetical protein